MDGAQLITSKFSLVLDLPPSCVQFCPAHPRFFVVGTYNLEKDEARQDEEESSADRKSQSRSGSLVIFRVGEGRL